MGKDRKTELFARGTLGCDCPGEVFEQIKYSPGGPLKGMVTRNIVIGNRLLITLWEVGDASVLQVLMPIFLVRGKTERDRRGLNRFRGVLVTEDPVGMESTAEACFLNCGDKDEKMHLHIVHREKVAFLLD